MKVRDLACFRVFDVDFCAVTVPLTDGHPLDHCSANGTKLVFYSLAADLLRHLSNHISSSLQDAPKRPPLPTRPLGKLDSSRGLPSLSFQIATPRASTGFGIDLCALQSSREFDFQVMSIVWWCTRWSFPSNGRLNVCSYSIHLSGS